MYRFYRRRSVLTQDVARAHDAARTQRAACDDVAVTAEHCFYVQTSGELDPSALRVLRWLLAETFDGEGLATTTFLSESASVIEIGPRPGVETAWSSTAVGICHVNHIDCVVRLERSRYNNVGIKD